MDRPFTSSGFSRLSPLAAATAPPDSNPDSLDLPHLDERDGAWAPYLTAAPLPSSSSSTTIGLDLAADDAPLRCVLPDVNAMPVLIPATSITRKKPMPSGKEEQQCKVPETVPEVVSPEMPQVEDTTTQEVKLAAAMTVPSPTTSVRKVSSGSLRRVKGRTFSRTLILPELMDRRSSPPQHRRVVTYPSVSGRLQHSEKNDLLAWSQPSMTLVHELSTTTRPASAGSLPKQDLPFRQRMKRISSAPSDPVSSEDGHALTSGGEEETDFQSETAFDSIRTYATTTSGHSRSRRGPRIESVFPGGDKASSSSTHNISPPPSSNRSSNNSPSDEQSLHRELSCESQQQQPPKVKYQHLEAPPDVRVSRQSSRKGHIRSQSVPARESPPATETPGKFGTWGLGNKGPSEDWDSDFDFDDEEQQQPTTTKRSGHRGMIVPQEIMERQASLHGQFGQVRELTLLVEELKRLGQQANLLHIPRKGGDDDLWKEAEGIVNLATVDDNDDDGGEKEERSRSRCSTSSSLTFSFDNTDSSNLEEDGDQSSSSCSSSSSSSSSSNQNGSTTTVLDIIYRQRGTATSDTNGDDNVNSNSDFDARSHKLPFDTQSLQDLVSRAAVVTRALKETVRKAEEMGKQQQSLDLNDDDFWDL